MDPHHKIAALAKLIRYYILISTTEAGSGHPTSSLSAAELMATLLFGDIFRFDAGKPEDPANDRLIFSKGHASPLLYALWAAAGRLTEKDLLTLRKFGSALEGHPTPAFPYADVATGSLGQGLSVGLGMAMAAKIDNLSNRIFVLLGDSEMAEGSCWEAMQLAAHYKLDNLIGIIDVNRLGQRGETMHGHNLNAYKDRVSAFGWEAVVVEDGHDVRQIFDAYKIALKSRNKPAMIIAKTIKGKGVSFLEDKDGWHGRALSRDELQKALAELGKVDKGLRGEIIKPARESARTKNVPEASPSTIQEYRNGELVATRKAYGNALVRIYPQFRHRIIALDAEVKNSTYSELFEKQYPEGFIEMFIAEQSMVGAAAGLASRGKLPFVSTFAAFFTRAFDQIRMSQYSDIHIVFCGSHAGVSIGQDGPSQMGLEDIAMFRTILDSKVLYPSDAIACEKLVEEAAKQKGIVYIRTTRKEMPVLYDANEEFLVGGSKILRQDPRDCVTVVAAGITLFEALKSHEELKQGGYLLRIIDLYSIKPIDENVLQKAARETKAIIVVEDHFAEGGMGEAVKSALAGAATRVFSLAVRKLPTSGAPEELMNYEEISSGAITKKVKEILGT